MRERSDLLLAQNICFLNGEKLNSDKLNHDKQAAGVSPSERGLAYGDGVFRTMRVYRGQLCFWREHQQVLQNDAKRLFLTLPPQEIQQRYLQQALACGDDLPTTDVIVKLLVTRNGAHTRGYWSDALSTTPHMDNFWVQVLPYTPPSHSRHVEGIRVGFCLGRLPIQPRLAGIKHLNRLEQVLLRRECVQQGYDEAVVLDASGFVVEGTMSNLFWWHDGVLYTPMLDRAGVSGVMRALILAWAKQTRTPWQEGHWSPARLLTADEVFFANSVQGIVPVRLLHFSNQMQVVVEKPFSNEKQQASEGREWSSFPRTHLLQAVLHPWET